MKHRLILASGTVLVLAFASVPGCSSAEDTGADRPALLPGQGGSAPGGAGAGQTAAAGSGNAAPGAGGSTSTEIPNVMAPGAAGMTGGVAPGTASGGAAGMGAGGMGAAGMGAAGMGAAGMGAVDPNALCPAAATAPSDNVACTITCTDPCGVHNLGQRLCTCANAVFDCATCTYPTPNPLTTAPPAALPPCALSDDLQEDDETGCDVNERCQSIGRTPGATDGVNRFCACLDNEWDCDTKPMGFP